MILDNRSSAPVFVLGCMRSGKTTLRRALQLAVNPPSVKSPGRFVELANDDGEGRTFWQAAGLQIGARRTGSWCCHAGKGDVTEFHRNFIGSRVASLCADGRYLISDNAHLLNKIGFVAEVLPQSRFLLVLHDLESMVGAMKRGFNKGNVNNEDYPPFVHYWPDCEFPCWSVLRNDRIGTLFSKHTWRRKMVAFARKTGLKKSCATSETLSSPRHAVLSEFQIDHPDLTRYYPGEGFCRLPEAWLKLNDNALRQLAEIGPSRWRTVCFRDLLDQPEETLRSVSEFLDWNISSIDTALNWIDPQIASSYPDTLSDDEQSTIQKVVAEYRDLFEHISAHHHASL